MRRHRKSSKRTRRHRGGFYGFDGKVASGAPLWSEGTEVPVKGGRKRKTRKTRRRGKKGGSLASASFQGDGVAGMADYKAVNTTGPA